MIQGNVSHVLEAIRPFAPEPAFALLLEQKAYVGEGFSSFLDGNPLEDFTPQLSAIGKQSAVSANLRDGEGRFPEAKRRSFPEMLDELARNKAPFASVVDKQLVIYGMLLLEGEEISALEEGNGAGSFCSVRRSFVFTEKFQSFSRWSQRSLPELPYFYPEALKMVELRFEKGAALFEPPRRSSLPSWLSAFHPGYLFPHVREHQLQAGRQRETGAGRFRIPFAHADVSTENFLLRLLFEDGTERCFGPQE
ncbi:MAG: hypothetical protein EOM17_14435, partial [Synergistales bacterium]|nr:hypothetical protein [Synergistales bacterium]